MVSNKPVAGPVVVDTCICAAPATHWFTFSDISTAPFGRCDRCTTELRETVANATNPESWLSLKEITLAEADMWNTLHS